MIYRHKYHEVEVREIQHDGTFSTRAGMVQAKKGDLLIYDPEKVVYVVGENPRDNAHNFDLVPKADFERHYEPLEDAPEDAKLKPALTDFGIHQFDADGRFLGYRTLVDEQSLKEAEDNRLAAAEAELQRQDEEEALLRDRAKAQAEAKAALDEAQKTEAEAQSKEQAAVPIIATPTQPFSDPKPEFVPWDSADNKTVVAVAPVNSDIKIEEVDNSSLAGE